MLPLSLLMLGFISLVAQIVMMRELMISFYGNEFFIGWILFGWLFWVGAGSVLTKFYKNLPYGLSLLSICHLLVAVLVPLEIFGVRLSKGLLTGVAGRIPDLIPTVGVSFLAMAPLCIVLGVWFAAASGYRPQGQVQKEGVLFIAKAYLYETLGFVLGGLAFSYHLVFLNEFQISSILIFLNLIVVFIFLLRERLEYKRYFIISAIGATFLGLASFVCSDWLNTQTAALRFPNEKLIETKNSIYGNLSVTRTADQYNFYQSGLPVGADRNDAFNEYLVHFPMLSHPNPQKVLLIGTGFNGALREILKYKPKQVFYADLDPVLIDLAHKYISSPLRQTLEDGRIRFIKGDLRAFLKDLPTDLDVAIINLPNPSTALLNRYFTNDFFKEMRLHLTPEGVLSTHLTFSPDAMSRPLENLGASIYRTMKDVFPSVVLLPEDELFMIASSGRLTKDPQVLIQRLRSRGIHNYFVSESYILYRYTNDRIAKVQEAFQVNPTAQRNFDLHPQGYLYNLIYWFSVFHQDLAGAFAFITRMNYFFILCLGVFLTLWPYALGKASGFRKHVLILTMSIGGFSLMSAEILVIYGFQVFYGNLYYKIAWIISAFMAGIAVGTYGAIKAPHASFGQLAKLHGGIGIYFILWLLILGQGPRCHWFFPQELWFVLALCIGILVGLEFVYANRLYYKEQKIQDDKARVGIIYAADLLGSCLGALWVSFFMIPTYGVSKTFLFLAVINASLAGLLFVLRKH